jgi:exodeoxyribonuclease VII large subunit
VDRARDAAAAGLPRSLRANTHAHFRRFAETSGRLTLGLADHQ